MSTVKVLVIDPRVRVVTEHDWDHAKDHDALYRWVGTSMLDHVTAKLDDGRSVCGFVDDIGLAKPELKSFFLPPLYRAPLLGNAVLFGANRKGETIDVPWSVDFVRLHIMWQRPARATA